MTKFQSEYYFPRYHSKENFPLFKEKKMEIVLGSLDRLQEAFSFKKGIENTIKL